MGLVKLTVLDLRNKVPGPGVAISPLLPVLSLFISSFFVTFFVGTFFFMGGGGGGGQGLVFISGAIINYFGPRSCLYYGCSV